MNMPRPHLEPGLLFIWGRRRDIVPTWFAALFIAFAALSLAGGVARLAAIWIDVRHLVIWLDVLLVLASLPAVGGLVLSVRNVGRVVLDERTRRDSPFNPEVIRQALAAKTAAREGGSGAVRAQRIEESLQAYARESAVQAAFNAITRSERVAIFEIDRNTVVTAAEGAWYDANLPIEDVLGGRLDAWPVWERGHSKAIAYLDANPQVRAVSFQIRWFTGVLYDILIARRPAGFVIMSRTAEHDLGLLQ